MGEKIVFIDANIFLELMLDNTRADEWEDFFNKLRDQSFRAITTDFIIYSCLLEIKFKLKSIDFMKKFVLFINELQNLSVYRSSFGEIYYALDLSLKYGLDFDDSLIVSVMNSNELTEIVSFDKHFDKVREIKRKEPNSIFSD